ncbi:hypothetical protein [Streptosporangium subroseum]|nr:hypothetical protein [Streptosporangium subroseum]
METHEPWLLATVAAAGVGLTAFLLRTRSARVAPRALRHRFTL